MTSIRRLEGRLRAWRSFRELAHAARSLAAAQSLRWSARADQAAAHLDRCRALAAGWSPPPTARRVGVLVGVGTDLGLCGRLNRLVADALVARAAALTAREGGGPLVITVGQRLRVELGERLAGAPEMPAPSSIEAALALAGRLERLLGGVAPPAAIDLALVLAGGTLPSGAPVIVTWDGASPEAAGAPEGAEGTGTEDGAPGPPSSLWGAKGRAGRGRDPEAEAAAARRENARRRRPPPEARLSPPERVWGPAAGLLLHARLVHALAAAGASEAAARLQTMSRAVDTSDRRIDEHERLLRKHRQESTTQEMLEVLGGRRGTLDAAEP